jgi:hypothetical protein
VQRGRKGKGDGNQAEAAAVSEATTTAGRAATAATGPLRISPMARAHATDGPSPLGFYNFAVSYHVAADLVADRGLKATHPESVSMFLYYHAIELYLNRSYGCGAIQQNGCAKSGMIFRPCTRAQRNEAFRLEKSRKRSWLCSTERFGAARAIS